jgi:hypothetical protein
MPQFFALVLLPPKAKDANYLKIIVNIDIDSGGSKSAFQAFSDSFAVGQTQKLWEKCNITRESSKMIVLLDVPFPFPVTNVSLCVIVADFIQFLHFQCCGQFVILNSNPIHY